MDRVVHSSESETPPNRLLALPLELREQIYAYVFAPCTWTTEHPFPSCLPSPTTGRFRSYANLTLVSHAVLDDVKAYFIKFVASRITFYFHTVSALRTFQHLARNHPILQTSTFNIRSGNTAARQSRAVDGRHQGIQRQSDADAEAIEALIRIQPGFQWWMDEVPGFYCARPDLQTDHGLHPRSSFLPPSAAGAGWKPRKYGIAVVQQTGGEVCDSPECPQKASGAAAAVEVTEVHYPPLHSRKDDEGTSTTKPLRLSCFIWTSPLRDRASYVPPGRYRAPASIMVLEGRLQDVWVPEKVVDTYLKQRRKRMD